MNFRSFGLVALLSAQVAFGMAPRDCIVPHAESINKENIASAQAAYAAEANVAPVIRYTTAGIGLFTAAYALYNYGSHIADAAGKSFQMFHLAAANASECLRVVQQRRHSLLLIGSNRMRGGWARSSRAVLHMIF